MPGKNVTQQSAATDHTEEINKTVKDIVSLIKAILANTEFWKKHGKGVSGRAHGPQGVQEMLSIKHANLDSHSENIKFLNQCLAIVKKPGLDPKTDHVTDAFYGYIKSVENKFKGDQNKHLSDLSDLRRYLHSFVTAMNNNTPTRLAHQTLQQQRL